MVRASILLLLAINYSPIIAQSFTAQQLLEKAINYHDPNDNWKTFSDEFTVVMTTPNASNRTSVISIDLPLRYFNVSATRDTTTTSYNLDKEQCYMSYNGIQLIVLRQNQKTCHANVQTCTKTITPISMAYR